VGALLGQAGEHSFLGVAVRLVQDLQQGLLAVGVTVVAFLQGLVQAHLQDLLDFGQDLGGDLAQFGQAAGDLGLDLGRQVAQHRRGLAGLEVGQHDGDGLGMLLADQLEKLPGVDPAQEVERPFACGPSREGRGHVLGGRSGLGHHRSPEAGGPQGLAQTGLVRLFQEFLDDLGSGLRGDLRQLGDLHGDGLDLLGPKFLEDLGREFRGQRHQQDRRLLLWGEVYGRDGTHSLVGRGRQILT